MWQRREDLLQTTERHLQKVADPTQRKTTPLRGAGEIGMAAGKALAKTGMGKYFRIQIQADGLSWHRRLGVIAQEAALDGIYVIQTKVPSDRMNAEQTRAAYQALSKVERAFRSLKATGLNEDGMKVMRYRDLLRELAAYSRNTLRFSQAEKATLTLYPTPSPLQQKAFDLLRLNPAL